MNSSACKVVALLILLAGCRSATLRADENPESWLAKMRAHDARFDRLELKMTRTWPAVYEPRRMERVSHWTTALSL